MSNNNLWTLDAIRARLGDLRGLGYSWSKIAAMDEFGGSSAGLLCSVLGGYEPKTAETRKRLGLPPMTVPVEPCTNPTCDGYGQPHTYDCQTQALINKPAEQRRKAKRTPRPRLSIHSIYPENAALSITNAKGDDRLYIERLISYLVDYLER